MWGQRNCVVAAKQRTPTLVVQVIHTASPPRLHSVLSVSRDVQDLI